jgi:hypothetical protein
MPPSEVGNPMLPEDLWKVRIRTHRAALGRMGRGDFQVALIEVEDFLETIPREHQGEALLEAHSLSPPSSYSRYGIELPLGRLAEAGHELSKAANWYLKAGPGPRAPRLDPS